VAWEVEPGGGRIHRKQTWKSVKSSQSRICRNHHVLVYRERSAGNTAIAECSNSTTPSSERKKAMLFGFTVTRQGKFPWTSPFR
jgi:hypothetical protein